MKTALILFRNPDEILDAQYISNVGTVFANAGFSIYTVEILPCEDEVTFTRSFLRLKDTVDNLIILDSCDTKFDLKQVIATETGTTLVENDNALKFLDAVSRADGVEYSTENAVIPMEATLVPNIQGAYQGFMLDNEEFTLVVLPADINQFRVTCSQYVLPYLENKFGIENKKETLKYFGSKAKLTSALNLAESNSFGALRSFVTEENGDFTVQLVYEGKDTHAFNEIIRTLYLELKDNLYSDYDASLSEVLFNLLKLKEIKLSVAESFTAGRVVSALIENSGASSYVEEGIVSYSNASKVNRLGVSGADIAKVGAVSSAVAYQMAAGLLKTGNCDMAISTTGIAGPKSDDTAKPVGLCYVGIGMKDGVHTFKLNLSGTREQITETAKNTALFLAIKKLKSI
ncbi:MAG: nicotinamide-nucleotide amidohydrolase family protein [Clostridia bacterium]|nr:nicotinamide-nucleotide amidohydrolase family protein [Clostridia bacterium]